MTLRLSGISSVQGFNRWVTYNCIIAKHNYVDRQPDFVLGNAQISHGLLCWRFINLHLK